MHSPWVILILTGHFNMTVENSRNNHNDVDIASGISNFSAKMILNWRPTSVMVPERLCWGNGIPVFLKKKCQDRSANLKNHELARSCLSENKITRHWKYDRTFNSGEKNVFEKTTDFRVNLPSIDYTHSQTGITLR